MRNSFIDSLSAATTVVWGLVGNSPRRRPRKTRRTTRLTLLRGEQLESLILLSGTTVTTDLDPNSTDTTQVETSSDVPSGTSSPAANTNATSYTLTGPASVPFGYVSSNYTITPNGVFTGTITVYTTNAYAVYIVPAVGTADQAEVTLTWNNSSAPQTFTIQQRDAWNPDSTGNMNIVLNASSSGALTDPASMPVAITPRPVELSRPYSEETYQQTGGRADMIVTGNWTTTNGESPTALEVSWNGGTWTTIWTNTTNATGSAVPFTGTLPSQAAGSGDFSIRWANDHAMTETEVNVTVGDVDPDPGEAPILPATFATPYQLPVGGTVWNIGTTAPGVGDSSALQYALHNSKLGDVIVLTAGATYMAESFAADNNGSSNDIVGFRIEPKSGTGWVYITTSAYAQLPSEGTRIDPSNLSAMATIESIGGPNGFSALTSVGAANNYRFVGIQFLATDTVYNLIWLGQQASSWDANVYSTSWANATDVNQLPHDIVFDRCIVQQTAANKQMQCGILMNGVDIAVTDSYIAGAHSTAEANDIFSWNGPGPFKIVNNYLEATASEILFGAADPTIRTNNGVPYQLVPSDIVVQDNLFEKLAIHNPNDPSYDGNAWLTKNQFEVKSGQRILLDGNVMDYDNGIGAGQNATAIVLTPRNSNGAAPYSVVQDITITNNIVHGAGQVFNMMGADVHDMWLYSGTLPTRRVSITNNVFDDVEDFFKNPAYPGVNASFATFNVTSRDDGGPIDLTISHNTWLFGPNIDPVDASFNMATGVVTVPNNGLIDGQKIMFSGNLPTGLTAGVTYWAHVIDANSFTVWSSIAYTGSNAYYVFPLQFSGQVTFSGNYTGGGKLVERFGLYSFDWQSGHGLPMTGAINFQFDDNIIDLGNYGIIIEASPYGTDGMDKIFQNYTFQGNLLIGNYNGVDYDTRGTTPNQNAPTAAAVGFTDYANGDYLLAPTSPYKNDGSDGTDPGVDWAAFSAATQNTRSGGATNVAGNAPAGANKTVTVLEDNSYTFGVSDFGFSDALDSPPNNFIAVKISSLPTAGTLTDNGTVVLAGQLIAVADVTAGKLRYSPAANASGTGYASFTFQVEDDGGGANLDPTANTFTFNVTPVNDPPVGTNKTVTTTQGVAYTFAVSDFGFSDPTDSPPNNFLAVKITTLPAAGTIADNGTAVTAGQIVSVADITAGKLKFTPGAGATGSPYTSFTFQVEDDGGTANGGINLDPSANTLSINVTLTNHPPVGTSTTVTTLEDTAYTFSAANFGFSDPNDNPANNFLAVKISTLPGAGSLTDNGVAVSVGQLVSVTDITSGKLKFAPAANANGNSYASFTFQVQDDGGGTNLDPTPKTMTVNVTAVNDPPVGANKTVTTLESTPYTFAAADFGFSDPNDSPPNNFVAVKITTLPALGSLADNGVAITAGQLVAVADITAGKLKFTPVAGAGGSPYTTFTFQVQDDGSGTNLDPTANTLTINVTSVNHTPVGTSKAVTTLEDTAYVFGVSDFGFTDPNDTPPNNFSSVKITTLPGAGSLSDNGVAISAGQLVPVSDITSGRLKFTPAANANGTGYSSFTFQVADDGGGTNLDPTPKTMTVNVTAVNDPPTGTSKTVTTLEDTSYAFSTADFGFSDAKDNPPNNFWAVVITTLPSKGTLTNGGAAVSAGQLVMVSSITAGNFKFTPAANANGAGYTSFTFQVADDGGNANGGSTTDPTPKTMTISVTAVNDAPAGVSKTVATLEGTAYTFGVADFGFSDPQDTPANNFLAVKITTLPAAGSLTDNGAAVAAGQLVPVSDITAGRLKFTPAANANGANYANFTFQVEDDGGTANGGSNLDPTPRTLTINVTSVNDAPSGNSSTVTATQNTPYTFAVGDFGFSDPNDTPANNFLAVKISTLPTAGSLTDNGVAVAVGQLVSVADITAGKLKFTPAANGGGTPYTTFTFQVEDDGGTTNGGVNLDPTPNTITINVPFSGGTYSMWPLAATPLTPDSGDGQSIEVGVRFTTDIDGYITGIRYYKSDANTGVHTGSLWSAGGQLLATATFTGEGGNGWQQVNFSSPVAVTAGTSYIASYHTTAGHYAVNRGFFNTSFSSGPLNVAPGGGVYGYGTGVAPTQSYQGSNYWVDVVFSTTAPVDTTPPTITSFGPTGGATGVATGAVVTIAFSEALNPASVNSTTVQLLNNATVVAASVSFNSATNTVTLTPTAALPNSTTFTVKVLGGAGGVKDVAGNALSATATSTFTTAAVGASTFSLWNTSATPATPAADDAQSIELGVSFTAANNGFIDGIRYYKSATNTGVHTGSLWSASGQLLATATFTGEGGSGWQQVLFSSPVAVTAGTTYVASYHTTSGHYAVNRSFFGGGFTSGPLNVPANGGVYRYGSGTMPNQSYQGSNYWVDVVYSQTPAVDTTPPTVTSFTPAGGATGVATGASATVAFSEAMNPASVNSGTVQLLSGSTVVAATVTYNAGSNTATLTPTAALANSTTYTIRVIGGASGVKDLAGNALAATVTSTFTTAAPSQAPSTASLWPATATPASADSGDGQSIELGVSFTANTSGYILGIRYYKSAANTGVHTGSLWSASGQLLATATFTDEGGSGWQQVLFSNPVPVTAGTTYVASYHTNSGHYAVTRGFFSGSFLSGSLNVPASGGVYRYGASGFPTQSYQSSNYWVDVVFSTTP